MRFFIKLAYDGKPYHGWQRQPNALSVQECVEESLKIIFRNPVKITGAGRTDTGVNAKIMYAHFDLDHDIDDKNKIINSLNRLLGNSIAVYDIIKVGNEAHARFDATERTYKYFISNEKNPFISNFSLLNQHCLDLNEMNKAAQLLLNTNDFTSFAKLHSDSKTNICNVKKAFWQDFSSVSSDYLLFSGYVFTITADRFLRNMVRAIVGTLLQIGTQKISLLEFNKIIESKNRCEAGVSVEPQGLFLWDIKYPYIS